MRLPCLLLLYILVIQPPPGPSQAMAKAGSRISILLYRTEGEFSVTPVAAGLAVDASNGLPERCGQSDALHFGSESGTGRGIGAAFGARMLMVPWFCLSQVPSRSCLHFRQLLQKDRFTHPTATMHKNVRWNRMPYGWSRLWPRLLNPPQVTN